MRLGACFWSAQTDIFFSESLHSTLRSGRRKTPSLSLEQTLNKRDQLCKKYNCEFDDRGNIGKRYRRQDEIGTPFCVTYDFDYTIIKQKVNYYCYFLHTSYCIFSRTYHSLFQKPNSFHLSLS